METQNSSKKSLNIVDCCADKTGSLIAVSSTEGLIIIFKKKKDKKQTELKKIIEIEAHKSAIWQIKWSNPEFGKILVTCGFDNKIKIWKIEKEIEKEKENKFTLKNIYISNFINSSVNSIDWGPSEFGLILSACTSSGKIIIIKNCDSYKNNNNYWKYFTEHGHEEPINSIVWAPKVFCENLESYNNLENKDYNKKYSFFATGSCDNKVYIWKFRTRNRNCEKIDNFENLRNKNNSEKINKIKKFDYLNKTNILENDFAKRNFKNYSKNNYFRNSCENSNFENLKDFEIILMKKIDAHKDWVRDLSWSKSNYRGYYLLASGSEDKSCKIWKIDLENNKVLGKEVLEFPSPVWKVSWNYIGNLLAIAFTSLKGINSFQIYKENYDGIWENVGVNK